MIKQAAASFIVALAWMGAPGLTQQVTGQDIDKILERADKLLAEAKAGYEDARTKNSVEAFVDAGFKLEEARIKYFVLQEIGSADKQKLAADRLRAVNQLSKLIHDGKVAITGSATDSPPVNPSDAPPSKDASPNPALSAARPAVEVSKRAQVPDAAKQREAEKLIKELFKEQYSKKTPADRKVLIRLLLDQAAKSQDDLVALWTLYREAQDVALQSCDVTTAVEIIEVLSRSFDVDSISMKNAALVAAGKAAKAPEEFIRVTDALLLLVEDMVGSDQYEAADKAMGIALQDARKSGDADLVLRVAARTKEITEAKSLFQAMKSVLETQARNPDDPGSNLEIGRFLCYVKGSWDLGLRFLIKGSDTALKALAQKEVSFLIQPGDRAAVADGWYELGEKEKSPLRKSQLLAHARGLYQSALPDAPALVRIRIEKRLGAMDAGGASAAGRKLSIDLLKLIDPAKDTLGGTCQAEGLTLVFSNPGGHGWAQIPFIPPDEYDLVVVAEKRETAGPYHGLLIGIGNAAILVDGFAGTASGIDLLDGNPYNSNESTWKGSVLKKGISSTITCQIRKMQVSVIVDGKTTITWKGDGGKHFSLRPDLQHPTRDALFIGSHDGTFAISRIALTPISGSGRRLR